MREPMSPVDAAWFHMEEPTDPMTVTATLWFDASPDWGPVLARIEERIVNRYPRFKHRIVDAPFRRGGPRWEEDPTFSLEAHVHRVGLPRPQDAGALQRLIADRVGTPLDLRFAPWSIDLVDGFGAGAAMVVRIHHCVADGLALAHVLLDLADDQPSDPVRTRRAPPEAHVDLVHHGRAAAAALYKLVLCRPDPRSPLKGPLGMIKRVAWSRPIPLARIKERGLSERATVNDVLVAAVSGAVRSWLSAHQPSVRDLRAFIPVDLREGERPDSGLGNRFGLVYLALPLAEPDPVGRMREIQKRMAAIKHTPEASVAFGVLTALGALPVRIEREMLRVFGAKGTLVLTNVRGPEEPIHIAGNRVAGLMFWVPQSGHVAIGVSLLSYAGELRVGISTDAGIVPDPEALVASLEAELGLGPANSGVLRPPAPAGSPVHA